MEQMFFSFQTNMVGMILATRRAPLRGEVCNLEETVPEAAQVGPPMGGGKRGTDPKPTWRLDLTLVACRNPTRPWSA